LHEEHGGLDPLELRNYGLSSDSLIDFSVNSNPFGPSPRIAQALSHIDISKYPDRNCSELTNRLAELNHTSVDQVLIGNGTAELIWLIAQAFLEPGDEVLIIGPTFSEYRRAATRLNALVTEIAASPPYFIPPLEKVIDFILKSHPRLVFLCNPNNPTGKFITEEKIQPIIAACGTDALLVIDKAYLPFVNGSFSETGVQQNLLVLRSMTKDFALAGLRLGYLLGDSSKIERMKTFQPAWSVNAFAQTAGITALSDLAYYENTLSSLREIQNSFFSEIKAYGFHIIESDVHFALIQPGFPADLFRAQLLYSGIQVRDCASFGLFNSIRIGTRLKEENQKLIEAMNSARDNLALHH
jgi:histidinol-phosphate aminotransferase